MIVHQQQQPYKHLFQQKSKLLHVIQCIPTVFHTYLLNFDDDLTTVYNLTLLKPDQRYEADTREFAPSRGAPRTLIYLVNITSAN